MMGQQLVVPMMRGSHGAHGGEVPMMEQFLPVPITGGYLGCPQWGDAHTHGFSAPLCRS